MLGLMHEKIGDYGFDDIQFVSAFDVGQNKVGKTIQEAIFADPNYVKWVDNISFCDNTMVKKSPTLDGVGVYVASMINPIKQTKTIDQLEKEADKSVLDLLQGKASIHETMIALQKADMSMQLLLNIRNKVIESYRDIMHMQF